MKTLIIEKKEYIPYEKTVTVNRAPTDESVKLLNEFQEKTINNLIEKGSIILPDCNFQTQYYKILDCFSNTIKCYLITKINGKKYEHNYTYSPNFFDKEQEGQLLIENFNQLFLKIIRNNLEIKIY